MGNRNQPGTNPFVHLWLKNVATDAWMKAPRCEPFQRNQKLIKIKILLKLPIFVSDIWYCICVDWHIYNLSYIRITFKFPL